MKTFIVSSLILFIASASVVSGQTVMALEEVRPGMIGVGMTVFEGTEPEEFEAHILGILHNINGPKRNLILARLSGGPLSDTGVIQGMSGSPVYIGGQLIGAVSYALGSFTTEAIAGITPIKEMVDAVAFPTPLRPYEPRGSSPADVTRTADGSISRDSTSNITLQPAAWRRSTTGPGTLLSSACNYHASSHWHSAKYEWL